MNDRQPAPKKKKLWTVLFVLINIAVIAATAVNEFSGSASGTIELHFTPRALFFLGCTAACLAVLFLAESLKYLLMMRSLGEKVSFRIAFETAALGKYYDCITPSGAGGQPFQILWLHRHGYSDGASSAMTITGYHEVYGKPVRWKIQNSWGDEKGSKGYYMMNDEWFDDYVYQAVVKKSSLPGELLDALDTDPIVLEPWDPMGTLAD